MLTWSGFRVLAWVGRLTLAAGLAVAASQADTGAISTLLVFLLVSLAAIILGRHFPAMFDFLFTLAALLNAALWLWDDTFLFFYDEIVHVYTPFTIALALGFQTYYQRGASLRGHPVFFAVIIASFGIAIGALWEICEWAAGFAVAERIIGTLDDTIHDLIADGFGAVCAALLVAYPLQRFLDQDRARRQDVVGVGSAGAGHGTSDSGAASAS